MVKAVVDPIERTGSSPRAAGLGATAVAVLAGAPLVVDDIYYQHVLVMCLVYVVLGRAWNLVGGYNGSRHRPTCCGPASCPTSM
jgi:hypothetical protein